MIDFDNLDLHSPHSAAALKTLLKDPQFTQHLKRETQFMGEAMQAISGAGVADGAQTTLLGEAMKHRRTLNGKTVMVGADGKEMINDKGLASVADWIDNVARGAMPFLFDAGEVPPKVAGAAAKSGGTSAATTERPTMKRSAFDALPPHEKMQAAKANQIID